MLFLKDENILDVLLVRTVMRIGAVVMKVDGTPTYWSREIELRHSGREVLTVAVETV